jgi:hypothetical protein
MFSEFRAQSHATPSTSRESWPPGRATLNRRQFQIACVTAIAGLASVLPSVASASTVVDDLTQQRYRYRLRYVRKGRTFSLWMRVSDTGNLSADVPMSLVLSTDNAAVNVVHSSSHVARALDSHIVRKQTAVTSSSWRPGIPLYASLRIGAGKASSKTWKMAKS